MTVEQILRDAPTLNELTVKAMVRSHKDTQLQPTLNTTTLDALYHNRVEDWTVDR